MARRAFEAIRASSMRPARHIEPARLLETLASSGSSRYRIAYREGQASASGSASVYAPRHRSRSRLNRGVTQPSRYRHRLSMRFEASVAWGSSLSRLRGHSVCSRTICRWKCAGPGTPRAQRVWLASIAQAPAHHLLHEPMYGEGARAVTERLVRDERHVVAARATALFSSVLADHIGGDDVERDAVRGEEGGDAHQRFRFRAGRRRLVDGEAECGEHTGRIVGVRRALLDPFGDARRDSGRRAGCFSAQ